MGSLTPFLFLFSFSFVELDKWRLDQFITGKKMQGIVGEGGLEFVTKKKLIKKEKTRTRTRQRK